MGRNCPKFPDQEWKKDYRWRPEYRTPKGTPFSVPDVECDTCPTAFVTAKSRDWLWRRRQAELLWKSVGAQCWKPGAMPALEVDAFITIQSEEARYEAALDEAHDRIRDNRSKTMSDEIRIGVNIQTTNPDAIKKIRQEVALLGAEAKTTGEASEYLSKVLNEEAKVAGGLADGLQAIIKGEGKYADAIRESAAQTLLNLDKRNKVATEYLNLTRLNEQASKAATAEEKRAAKEAADAARQKLALMEQIDSSARKSFARVQAEMLGRAQSVIAEQRMEREAATGRQKMIEDTIAGIRREREERLKSDQDRRVAAADYTAWWGHQLDKREAAEKRQLRENAKAFRKHLADHEKEVRESADRIAATVNDATDGRSTNRRARALLLPFLGQGGAQMGPLGRIAVTGASFAAGTPGGEYGQVGLLSEASSVVSRMGTAGLVATAGAFVAVGLAKELYSITKASTEAAQELTNFANRLGLGTAEAERLQIMSKIVGVNFASLEAGARKLAAGLEEPNGAGRATADALRRMGIETQELTGKSREVGPVLLDFLSKLSKIPSETERIRLASLALGRESRELLPLLKNYSELDATVRQLGVTMSEGTVAELTRANQEINKMETAWEKLKKSLSAKIAPIVIPFVQTVTSLISPTSATPLNHSLKDYEFNPATGGYRLKSGSGSKDPMTTLLNFGSAQGERTAQDAASAKFRDSLMQTDELAISHKISDLKNQREDLQGKLSGRLDSESRTRLQGELNSKTAEERALEARLRGLRERAKPLADQIGSELEGLLRQVETIEARAAGEDTNEARKKAFLRKLRGQDATPAQLEKGGVAYDRLIAAQSVIDAQDVAKHRADLESRQRRAELTSETTLGAARLRSAQSEPESKAAIEELYAFTLAEAKKVYAFELAAANSIADEKERQKAVDSAISANVIRGLEAQQAHEMQILNLQIRQAEQKKALDARTRELIRSSERSELGKDFNAQERLAQAKAGFGEGPFAAMRALQIRKELASQLYQMEMDIAATTKDAGAREIQQLQAFLDLKAKGRDAEREHEIAIAEFRKKEMERVREEGGKVWDALTTKGFSGLKDLATAPFKGAGRTLFQNGYQEFTNGSKALGLDRIFSGQTETGADGTPKLTTVGRLLAGTPFGVDTSKMALEANTNVTKDNSRAVYALTQALSGGAASGGPIPGFLGLDQVLSNPAIISEKPKGLSDLFGGLFGKKPSASSAASGASGGWDDVWYAATGESSPGATAKSAKFAPFTTAGGRSSVAGGLFNSGATGGEKLASGAATAGALVGAAFGVLSGIKEGGARGGLTAASSVLGAAAALDPEPISKGILMLSALGTSLFKGVLGDPKKIFDQKVNDTLKANTYTAPEGRSVTSDLYGNDVSYDARGQARFMTPAQPIVVNVNAMDSQSFITRSSDIAAAVNHAIVSSRANPLVSTIQQAAFA